MRKLAAILSFLSFAAGLFTAFSEAQTNIQRPWGREAAPIERCLVKPSKEKIALMEADFKARPEKVMPLAASIPVYYHIVFEGYDRSQGYVSDSFATATVAALNNSFSGSGFNFYLAGITRTLSVQWYVLYFGSIQERQMKTALRQGGASALNIYSLRPVDALGWAYFPFEYAGDPIMDGVTVNYETAPGGTNVPYNLGYTAVHEAGHWLGLYHTFENFSCTGSHHNDFVSDTNREKNPSYKCNLNKDSCPDKPGFDNVRNFMNYSPDACMTNFTPGQFQRAQQQFAIYR